MSNIKKGMRFLHARLLDPSKMPDYVPQLFQVTKVAGSQIYYRPVYNYGEREQLGGGWKSDINTFLSKYVKEWVA